MPSDRDILPDTVKPSNYNLSLHTLKFVGDWSYQGTLKIDLDIKKAAKEITLNAIQLEIHGAQLLTEQSKTESTLETSEISYDVTNQRATLKFAREFAPTPKATLIINFQGTMNNTMAGFYRSKYKPVVEAVKSVPRDDEYHYMFSTQFESTDARRAFPCFDEPNLKASFEFEIEIPEDQLALSNMPEKETKPSSIPGYKVVSFQKAPIMSTYLFAWAFGEFECIETVTKRKYNGQNLPVRVYTTRGLKHQGEFALSVCHQVVDYFSEVFQIDYPLPKVDLLAVHEFSHGAMENWGLITYRTTALLFDEKSSDKKYKQAVAYVVSHELAHQWFGNLVTMDWWNELWLNEGFATWVGWLAVHKLYPEWNVWAQFCAESLNNAFNLDSIRNSHPIEVPVRDALEVAQIFDHISYLKGSSVIRMLSSHLGNEVFLQGVADYLKAHKYSNATTQNLWDALSKASNQDINAYMDPWIQKIGFPVVKVAEESGQITIEQSRFLISGDAEAKEDETVWWIPLGLKTTSGTKSFNFSVKSDTIREIDDSFYKLNANSNGFYRTCYPPERLSKLGQSYDKLTLEDRIGLIGDAAALAQSGDSTTSAFLSLIEGFSDETDFRVWSQILSSLGHVKSIFGDVPEISDGLNKFTLKLVGQVSQTLGWEFAENEPQTTGQLRSLIIGSAGASGDTAIIAEAQKRFQAFVNGDTSAINPSLRLPIFRTVIHNGGDSEVDAIKTFYRETQSIDGKEIALQSLGAVPTADAAAAVLEFTFTDAVAIQDKHSPALALAANVAQRAVIWPYVKANWDAKVFPQLSGNFVVLERWLRGSLGKYADLDVEKDIGKFFEDKDQGGYDRGLSVARDNIIGAAKYKERDLERTKEWLKAKGYC